MGEARAGEGGRGQGRGRLTSVNASPRAPDHSRRVREHDGMQWRHAAKGHRAVPGGVAVGVAEPVAAAADPLDAGALSFPTNKNKQ